MASVAKREWTHNDEPKTAWVVRYKDGGKHRSRQFERKKEADAFRQRVEREMHGGMHVPKSETVTVSAAVEQYIAGCEVRHREGKIGRTHLEHTRHYLRKHVTPHLGHIRLTDLTWAPVESWRQGRLVEGGLAKSTTGKLMNMFKCVLDFAEKRGQLKRNVAVEVIKDSRGGEKDRIRTFDKAETLTLLQSTKIRFPKGQHRMRAFMECAVHIAAFCGLRRGEIMGLTWENVDLDRRLIFVRHNLTLYGELKGPKTRSGIRDVPMPTIVADLISGWRPHHVPNDRDLIFTSREGTPFTSKTFHDAWHYLLRAAELDKPDREGRVFRFHALRHFAASLMIERGVPLLEVASLLGHSHVDMTLQVYAHPVTRGNHRHAAVDDMVAHLASLPRALPAPVAQEMRTGP